MAEKTPTEETALAKDESKTVGWTRREIFVVAILAQINFADGIELYLPGVITQFVGCQLGLSEITENILGVSFYMALVIAIIFGGVLENKLGSRMVLILSMYMSIIAIIICAILPTFYTLILARVVIGLGCGINFAALSTYNGQSVTEKNRKVSATIVQVAFSVGTAWISLFGYFALSRVGWRIFIILSSLPFFVGPLVLLHFFIPEKSNEYQIPAQPQPKASFKNAIYNTRVLKKCFLEFGVYFVGHGSILLFPVLIRYSKSEEGTGNRETKCENAVQGEELLFLTIAGIGNISGRFLTHFMKEKVSFRLNLLVHCSMTILCLAVVTIFNYSLVIIVIAMSLIKLSYGSSVMEVHFMSVAVEYFGAENFEAMNVLTMSIGTIGSALGVTNALFVNPTYATLAPLIMIGVALGTAMSIKDYNR